MKTIKLLPPALALAGALAIAGCSGGETDAGTPVGHHSSGAASPAATPSGRAQTFAQADVMFAQGMIPHHRQALEMSALAGEQASDPEVKRLAAAIERTQDPEIATMSGWLTAWGKPVPGGSSDGGHAGHGGSGHGDMDGAGGMMSEEDMRRLRAAEGAAFDRLFLEQMIEHHRGAVTMAEKEIRDGRYGPAVALAKVIVKSQSAEIATMERMLAG
ncbi:MAG: DUF305 domain-containing protein [Streptosporangiales bacterium]|nr:DUF305 domain-containing protein [Streptosporangiales bacterium]